MSDCPSYSYIDAEYYCVKLKDGIFFMNLTEDGEAYEVKFPPKGEDGPAKADCDLIGFLQSPYEYVHGGKMWRRVHHDKLCWKAEGTDVVEWVPASQGPFNFSDHKVQLVGDELLCLYHHAEPIDSAPPGVLYDESEVQQIRDEVQRLKTENERLLAITLTQRQTIEQLESNIERLRMMVGKKATIGQVINAIKTFVKKEDHSHLEALQEQYLSRVIDKHQLAQQVSSMAGVHALRKAMQEIAKAAEKEEQRQQAAEKAMQEIAKAAVEKEEQRQAADAEKAIAKAAVEKEEQRQAAEAEKAMQEIAKAAEQRQAAEAEKERPAAENERPARTETSIESNSKRKAWFPPDVNPSQVKRTRPSAADKPHLWPKDVKYLHKNVNGCVPERVLKRYRQDLRKVLKEPPKGLALQPIHENDPRGFGSGHMGVVATEDLQPGQSGVYTGDITRSAKSDNDNVYVMNLLDDYVIDASKSGGFSRFINDARGCGKKPNVAFELMWCKDTGHPYAAMVIKHPIRSGQELLCEYGPGYWSAMQVNQIKCGACGRGDKERELFICDKCHCAFHGSCLLQGDEIPSVDEKEWFCPSCQTIAQLNPRRRLRGKEVK